MRVLNGALATTLILIASTGLVQCGQQKGKTANVAIYPIPAEPIVITADVTAGGKKFTAPWFDFTMKLRNGSDQAFVIVAIMAQISITDNTGAVATKDYAGDPGQSNFENDVIICQYADFGTFTVGEEDYIKITHADTNCPNGVRVFRVDALPKPISANNYRYRVKLKPLGYFVDSSGLPEDRFEKDKIFYTQ